MGTEEQKQRYLVPQAKGVRIGAFGLTEPGAGSDVAAMSTTAVLDGNHYILNGQKRGSPYVILQITLSYLPIQTNRRNIMGLVRLL